MPTPRKTDDMHWLTGSQSQAKKDGVDFVCQPGRPRYPKKQSAAERVVFKRMCSLLEKRRALTDGDIEILNLYATLSCRWEKAKEKLAIEGEVCMYTRLDSNGKQVEVEKYNLWLKVAETSEKNMAAILAQLGLTPNARAKVKPTASTKPVEREKTPEELAVEEQKKYETDFLARTENRRRTGAMN